MGFGHNGNVALESSLPAAIRRGMRRVARRAKGDGVSRSLHLVVCGGDLDEWSSRSEAEWSSWAADIARSASLEGVGSVTAYPLLDRAGSSFSTRRWTLHGVVVTASGQADGRQRLADVIDAWPTGLAMTEETLGHALVGPGGEPDVVAVIGAHGRLPSALVWELAYAELVDVAADWRTFSGQQLSAVIGEFRTRHRRFGGIETDATP